MAFRGIEIGHTLYTGISTFIYFVLLFSFLFLFFSSILCFLDDDEGEGKLRVHYILSIFHFQYYHEDHGQLECIVTKKRSMRNESLCVFLLIM